MVDSTKHKIHWNPIESSVPPQGIFVHTKIDDKHGVRNVQLMKLENNLWFLLNGTHVYYTPTHWAHKYKFSNW